MLLLIELTCCLSIFLLNQIVFVNGRIKKPSVPPNPMRNSDLSRLEELEPGFDLDDADIKKFHIWPMGVIPYFIDDFSFDKVLRDKIRFFLDRTNQATGLHFMEIPNPPTNSKSRWVLFINRQGHIGCADHSFKNFTNEGVQKVVLGYNCLNAGEELAEVVLLLVGVPPQHNAPNRDEYVTVNFKNILPEKAYLFELLKNDEWLFHDVPYDFYSVGHFSPHKHTSNGAATVAPKVVLDTKSIKKAKTFSSADVWKVRMLYNYILKKQSMKQDIPECEMIFSRGSNFTNYEPESEDDLNPRPKPNQYLGRPSESSYNNDGKDSSDANNLNANVSGDFAKDSSEENNATMSESKSSLDIESDLHKDNKNASKLSHLKKMSKVMDFSDYATDD